MSAQTMTMTRHSDRIGSRYSISVVGLSDEGEYFATAENEYGTAITKGYVKVVQGLFSYFHTCISSYFLTMSSIFVRRPCKQVFILIHSQSE